MGGVGTFKPASRTGRTDGRTEGEGEGAGMDDEYIIKQNYHN